MVQKITLEVPDDVDLEKLMLPEGWARVKTGKSGRPREDLKRIAVALARHWRMDQHSETKTQAIKWICHHWQHHGIHDDARARARTKEAIPLLNHSLMTFLPGGGMCFKLPIKNGSRGWMWHHGLHEAVEIKSVNCKATFEVDRSIRSA